MKFGGVKQDLWQVRAMRTVSPVLKESSESLDT